MSIKKYSGQLTDEELLNVMEQDDNSDLEKPPDHSVIRFLSDFSIYPGTEKVKKILLYKLYYHHTDIPVSREEFYLLLSGLLNLQDDYCYTNKYGRDLAKNLADYLHVKKQPKKVKSYYYRKHIENFISVHNLQSGNVYVDMKVLYFFYDKWQYNSKIKTRLDYKNFLGMIKLFFKTKRSNKVWCLVAINKEFVENNKQDFEKAKIWSTKFNASHEKKEDITKEKSSRKNKIRRAKT